MLGLALLLTVACSDYKLNPSGDNGGGDDTQTRPENDDTGPPDQDCPVETLPGYETVIDDLCENEVQVGGFTPVIEWRQTSFAVAPSYNNVMMQPVVASLTDDDGDGDIDSDDTPDIIFVSYPGASWTGEGVLRAVSGDGSGSIFDLEGTGIAGSGSLAAGDIDGDGIVEIIGATHVADQVAVVAFEHDGTEKWRSAPTYLSSCYAVAPALADLEGDGSVEVVVGNIILESDGSTRATGSGGIGACASFPADVDGDGDMEIVAGSTLYDHRGNTLWSSGADGYPAVADFDGDGLPEIVVSDGSVRLMSADTGGVRWTAAGAGLGPPTIADYDGDGLPEVGVAGTSSYTVLDTDGSQLWQNRTTDGSSGRTGSAVFDFEGDGAAEVVYADEYSVWVFSGVDGSVKLQDVDHTSWTWIEYSVVVDVDGDGQAEIVAPNGQISSETLGMHYGISVIGDADESWQPGRKIWNQHAYHITNVNDDGTIPRIQEPNWLRYNNFRSGDLSAGDGTSAPDAVVVRADLCELDCDDGALVVYVHPGNEGLADLLAGGRVEIRAQTPSGWEVVASETLPSLASGWIQDALRFEITGTDPATLSAIEAEILPVEPECDEDNNAVRWTGPFCE